MSSLDPKGLTTRHAVRYKDRALNLANQGMKQAERKLTYVMRTLAGKLPANDSIASIGPYHVYLDSLHTLLSREVASSSNGLRVYKSLTANATLTWVDC